MMIPEDKRRQEVRWAIVRLILAFIQIAGATASVILLISSGINLFSVTAVAITGLFTLLSRILFSRRASQVGK
jgi:hypothetical protein